MEGGRRAGGGRSPSTRGRGGCAEGERVLLPRRKRLGGGRDLLRRVEAGRRAEGGGRVLLLRRVKGERRVRLDGGELVLLIWRVEEEDVPKEEDAPSFASSKPTRQWRTTRTPRRRRTRPPPLARQRGARAKGGGHALLLQLVEEGRRVRHRTAFACLVCSFAASCLLKRARLSTCLDFEEKSAISRLWSADQRGKVKTCAWSGARRRQVGGGVGSGGGK